MPGRCVRDPAATILVGIHWNLAMGTIASNLDKQPHLQALMADLESFRVCGQFMLTEVGHGLDARNIETTATLSDDGSSFDFHSPSPTAAKSMPPVTPLGGVPKVAVVFAQLVIRGEVQGVRSFVVQITDGDRMCSGISSIMLPPRPGGGPLDHAITTFTHVRLGRECLLGPLQSTIDEKRAAFMQQIHRVSVGTLSLSLCNIPALKAASYLAYTFSQQRKVNNPALKSVVPIWYFPTQYGPIISVAAQAAVLEAAGRFAIGLSQLPGLPEPLRLAVGCIFKATVTSSTQRHLIELTDRCGWRGLYAFNRISQLQLIAKGNSIAEGDVMVLCIRLASELLQGKYEIPKSENPTSLLARHEQGVFEDLQSHLKDADDGDAKHRSETFAQNVTPRSRELIEAIGQRFAYDSALDLGTVRQELIDVYEAECILQDQAWYVENAGMTSREIRQRYTLALEKARPHMQSIIADFGMAEHFDSTPLVSTEHWNELMHELPSFHSEQEHTAPLAVKQVSVTAYRSVDVRGLSRFRWIFQAARSVLF